MSRDKFILSDIFYDVYYYMMQPSEKKIIRSIDDSILEGKLENFMLNIMGYSTYRKYTDYIANREIGFEYFAGIRKYFENIITNYNPQSGISIYDFIDQYSQIFKEYIESLYFVNILISALRKVYSKDSSDFIISHRNNTLVVSRQSDKFKEEPPMTCIQNARNLDKILENYVYQVVIGNNNYNKLFSDDFGYSKEEAIENLFMWTLRNASATDLADVERFFSKYTCFIQDTSFDDYSYPVKIGDIFDDSLYVMKRKATAPYETPYYLRFMLRNNIVEFANIRYGICDNVAYVQAIQTSQEIDINDNYLQISEEIKKNLPKSRYYREFNPMHMASLALFFGMINGMGIKKVYGCDYFSLRYQRLEIDEDKSEEEMNRYQHRLTNKYVNTFLRLLEYTDDIDVLEYPFDGDEFSLLLSDDIHFTSPILQQLYDMGYAATKKNTPETTVGL